jgi:hypothetical protein
MICPYGTAEEAAEKLDVPPAKSRLVEKIKHSSARVNSCPDTKPSQIDFFSNL